VPELTYLEAINAALHDEMEADPRVFCLGEDVGRQGGAFGATKGIQQKYGELRSIDTPVAEAGIAGVAIGAAMAGQRPVAEMQFGDFVSIAFDQIVTCAAKMHYRIGWAVPMVVRCPNGGGVGGGPYHSENVEAWFHHHAGLKIVCPATADDAYGLLRASIQDPNPVVFCEHKFLYRREKADVATVLESVRKTGKAMIVHEDNLTGGFGAEVAAIVAQEAFEHLDAPVTRVAAIDTPIPFTPVLEREYLPTEDDILRAARDLAAY